MSQRESGYERKLLDQYETPAWVTLALVPHLPEINGMIWVVAMLLRTDFDHAATRAHLFARCPMFAKKVVLTKRIRWFEDSRGSPSFNHCWMIWDRQHRELPTLAYASGSEVGLWPPNRRPGARDPDLRAYAPR
jgi:hypothetical protein